MLKLRVTTTSLSSLQGSADPPRGLLHSRACGAGAPPGGHLRARDLRHGAQPEQHPALPVRDDADVFVWMTIFRDEADHTRRVAEIEQSSPWRDRIARGLAQHLDGQAEVLRLRPTSRTLIHG
jgi:hypothetical protein